MNLELTRRDFIARTTATAGLLTVLPHLPASAAGYRTRIHQAMIVAQVTEEALKPLKEAGFEGVESTHVCPEKEAEKGRETAKALGMTVHSLLRGWMEFNSDDPQKVATSIEDTRVALRAAKAYGASAILVVPCRVEGLPMPEPWEFDITFDPKNGHVKQVAAGNNEKYEAYIKAQNKATDMTRAAVEQLMPLAEELKVIIALENVWNNLWVKPDLFQNLVASFHNKWVKAYFDIGNHVKYAPPQDWIRTLGPLIAKLHIKDFLLNPDGHGGKFVHPRDGSIKWPEVRKALDEVNYNGWATIEDRGLSLEEFKRRFDLIIAGK